MPLLYPTFTSETRTGDTDSSTNNVNENGTAVNTDAGEKAYRKAEEAFFFAKKKVIFAMSKNTIKQNGSSF